jgi:hypothetical protein
VSRCPSGAPALRILGVKMSEQYPFNDDGPPSVEELRYIAKRLRESDGEGMFPKMLCEIYADLADKQADSIERVFKLFKNMDRDG